MLPLHQQFQSKPTWTVTSTTKLNSYNSLELITYSDGEILFWDATNNINIGLSFSDVEKLRKVLGAMKPPVVVEKVKSVPVSEEIKFVSPFNVVKSAKVYSHSLDETPSPKITPDIVASIVKPKGKVSNPPSRPIYYSGPKEVTREVLPVSSKVEINKLAEEHKDIVKGFKPTNAIPNLLSTAFKEQMKAIMDTPTGDPKDTLKTVSKPVAKPVTKSSKTPVTSKKDEAVKVKSPTAVSEAKTFERKVAKEEKGWGVNVSSFMRYYYATRDTARSAVAEHKIGSSGRIA